MVSWSWCFWSPIRSASLAGDEPHPFSLMYYNFQVTTHTQSHDPRYFHFLAANFRVSKKGDDTGRALDHCIWRSNEQGTPIRDCGWLFMRENDLVKKCWLSPKKTKKGNSFQPHCFNDYPAGTSHCASPCCNNKDGPCAGQLQDSVFQAWGHPYFQDKVTTGGEDSPI